MTRRTLLAQITKAEEEMLGPDDELPIDLRVRAKAGSKSKADPGASNRGHTPSGVHCSSLTPHAQAGRL